MISVVTYESPLFETHEAEFTLKKLFLKLYFFFFLNPPFTQIYSFKYILLYQWDNYNWFILCESFNIDGLYSQSSLSKDPIMFLARTHTVAFLGLCYINQNLNIQFVWFIFSAKRAKGKKDRQTTTIWDQNNTFTHLPEHFVRAAA